MTRSAREVSALALLVVAGGAGLSGHCAPAARERLRDFLFEVPAPRPARDSDRLPPSQSVPRPLPAVHAARSFASAHPSFTTRQCADCHDPAAGQTLREPWTAHCAACHPPLFAPRPFLHGPAAAAACNECHLPHVSALPALLRRPDPDLCLACHESTLRREGPNHGRLDLRCTACHDAHGGDDHRMLRPDHLSRIGRVAPDSPGGRAFHACMYRQLWHRRPASARTAETAVPQAIVNRSSQRDRARPTEKGGLGASPPSGADADPSAGEPD